MRPVCAFSPCMPRPQRPGPSRAWRLWGRAFPHLIPGRMLALAPEACGGATQARACGRGGECPGRAGRCGLGWQLLPQTRYLPGAFRLGLGREPRLLSGFVNWKTDKRCGWEQVEPEGEAGSEEEGRGGQAALREDGEELRCPRCPHWG